MSPQPLSAAVIARAVRSRRISAVQVLEEALRRIAEQDGRLNCFTAVTRERAYREARSVDATIVQGRDPGPLAGVPYAVKNLFDVTGLPTLAGSRINADRPPAAADATAAARLTAAGGVLVGTLNMDEYAYGFTTENSHYGPTRNPHDETRIAGGSSGGSAAAVAAGLVPLTLGSDTNGSIRVPSSLCGVFGLKPTFGQLSRAGSFPFVPSLDHVGPFAATVEDLALAYEAMQGPDPADPACREETAQPVLPSLQEGIEGLRIGVAGGYFQDHAGPAARQAVVRAAEALGVTRLVTIPEAAEARAAAFVITAAEGGQLHLPELRSRMMEFDPQVRDRLLAGALVPAAWVLRAQRFRRRYHRRLLALFETVDLIIAAATPVPATLIGQQTMELAGQTVPVRPNLGLLAQPISFAGLPVAAVPIGGGTLPIGVQLIAAPWREDHCLRAAVVLERLGATGSGRT